MEILKTILAIAFIPVGLWMIRVMYQEMSEKYQDGKDFIFDVLYFLSIIWGVFVFSIYLYDGTIPFIAFKPWD